MKRIYLCEDNPDNADLLMDMLSDDYDIEHFLFGQELLDALEAADQPPDIFVLDIDLPHMDGMTLLKNIRHGDKGSDRPALALTAHAMVRDRQRFIEAGFNGYMSKPIVDEDELREEIEKLLQPS